MTDCSDGTYSVSYTASTSGQYSMCVLMGGKHIGGSPFQVSVEAAQSVGSCSMLNGVNEHMTIAAGEQIALAVEAKDRFGNRCTRGGDAVVAELRGMDKRVALTVRDMADGSYELCGTVEVSGEYELSVELGGESVIGSGRTVEIAPAEASVEHCMLSQLFVDGAQASLLVTVVDRFGNVRSGLDDLSASVVGATSTIATVVCSARCPVCTVNCA